MDKYLPTDQQDGDLTIDELPKDIEYILLDLSEDVLDAEMSSMVKDVLMTGSLLDDKKVYVLLHGEGSQADRVKRCGAELAHSLPLYTATFCTTRHVEHLWEPTNSSLERLVVKWIKRGSAMLLSLTPLPENLPQFQKPLPPAELKSFRERGRGRGTGRGRNYNNCNKLSKAEDRRIQRYHNTSTDALDGTRSGHSKKSFERLCSDTNQCRGQSSMHPVGHGAEYYRGNYKHKNVHNTFDDSRDSRGSYKHRGNDRLYAGMADGRDYSLASNSASYQQYQRQHSYPTGAQDYSSRHYNGQGYSGGRELFQQRSFRDEATMRSPRSDRNSRVSFSSNAPAVTKEHLNLSPSGACSNYANFESKNCSNDSPAEAFNNNRVAQKKTVSDYQLKAADWSSKPSSPGSPSISLAENSRAKTTSINDPLASTTAVLLTTNPSSSQDANSCNGAAVSGVISALSTVSITGSAACNASSNGESISECRDEVATLPSRLDERAVSHSHTVSGEGGSSVYPQVPLLDRECKETLQPDYNDHNETDNVECDTAGTSTKKNFSSNRNRRKKKGSQNRNVSFSSDKEPVTKSVPSASVSVKG